MKYCPECGKSVSLRWQAKDQRNRLVCGSCGTVHYDNPKVVVTCLAYWQDRLLMCRRAHAPDIGRWTPPSGFMEIGETLEEAAIRETMEETQVQLAADSLALYAVASLPHIREVHVTFRAQLREEPRPVAGAECLEVALWNEAQFPWNDLAFLDPADDMPQRFFMQLRTGEFAIHQLHLRLEPERHTRRIEYRLANGARCVD
jgi:ADP-ribose pyrophosphatase YjhB (NUDIX family)